VIGTVLIVLITPILLGVGIGIGVALGLEVAMRASGDGRAVLLTFARVKKNKRNAIMNDQTGIKRLPVSLTAQHMVQPFWFGDPAYKATGWYLRGLPPLVPTDMLTEPERGSDEWKRWGVVHRMARGPERARLRNWSHPGMMAAARQ
jgi:hypothetical protein